MAQKPPWTLAHRLGDAFFWLAAGLLVASELVEHLSGDDSNPWVWALAAAAGVALILSGYGVWLRDREQTRNEP